MAETGLARRIDGHKDAREGGYGGHWLDPSQRCRPGRRCQIGARLDQVRQWFAALGPTQVRCQRPFDSSHRLPRMPLSQPSNRSRRRNGDLINDGRRNEPPVHVANSWSGVRSAVQSTKTNSSSSSGHERAGACQPSIGRQRQLCFIAGVLDCLRAGALPCWTIAFMVASMLILPGTS